MKREQLLTLRGHRNEPIFERRIATGGTGLDLSAFSFGIQAITANVITVNGGTVYHYPQQIECADADVTIGGTYDAPQWIILKYTVGVSAAILTTTFSTVPVSEKSILYRALYRVYVDEAGVAHYMPQKGIRCLGDIIVGSFWSAQ